MNPRQTRTRSGAQQRMPGWLRCGLLVAALGWGAGIQPAPAQFTLLHSFTGGDVGANPVGSPALSGSTLFGMTSNGGIQNWGTVFQIDSRGTGFTIVHVFPTDSGSFTDGKDPSGSLTLSGSTLYGVTSGG